jgi:hypothetical protein
MIRLLIVVVRRRRHPPQKNLQIRYELQESSSDKINGGIGHGLIKTSFPQEVVSHSHTQ